MKKKISSSSVLNVLLPINACHGAVPTGPSLMSARRITKCLLEKVRSSMALLFKEFWVKTSAVCPFAIVCALVLEDWKLLEALALEVWEGTGWKPRPGCES